MKKLSEKKCIPCEVGGEPISVEAARSLALQIDNRWKLNANKRILADFRFNDFKGAMAFVNKVAEIAEMEGHHPDLHISWDSVEISLTTHATGGLSENDFILAAKIDNLL